MIDIQDNFLSLKEFEQLHSGFLRWDFPWYTSKVVNDNELSFIYKYIKESRKKKGKDA